MCAEKLDHLIPYRSLAGKIQACQIRLTGTLKPNLTRYLWLSLPKMNSSGSGTPLHFASWKTSLNTDLRKPLLITEGALKADVTAHFLPRYYLLAISGVRCSHDLVANISRGKSVYLAFDNDYQDNPAVLRQIIGLLKLRINACGGELTQSTSTKILAWSRTEKGIDDAVAKHQKIRELTIPEWFSSLDENCRETVRKVWENE